MHSETVLRAIVGVLLLLLVLLGGKEGGKEGSCGATGSG